MKIGKEKVLVVIVSMLIVIAIASWVLPFISYEKTTTIVLLETTSSAAYNGFDLLFGRDVLLFVNGEAQLIGDEYITLSSSSLSILSAAGAIMLTVFIFSVLSYFDLKEKNKYGNIGLAIMLIFAGVLILCTKVGFVKAQNITESFVNDYTLGLGAYISGICSICGGYLLAINSLIIRKKTK